MTAFISVWKRELQAFFAGPLAYVFIGVYLLLSGLATWNIARFFDTARVDLSPFFQFQPWFLAILAPAIGMRLWSEDLKTRTSDIYFTAPVSLMSVHLAKALAGLTVLIAAIAATLPYWMVVSYLGAPDHGLIALNYLHLIFLSALFLLVAMMFSALTRQQVVALVLGVSTNLLLLVAGLNLLTGVSGSLLGNALAGWIGGFGLFDLITNAQRGVLRLSDPLVYLGLGALFAILGVALLDARRRPGAPVWKNWNAATLAVILLAFPIGRLAVEDTIGRLRIDFTGYQLNTLSPGARALARNLHEPVELTLYYSEGVGADYPNIRTHADRVAAMLDAFSIASHGKIRVRRVNPEPFSRGEDDAITDGITAIQTEGIDPLYFGLSGENLIDDVETIAFLAPEQDHRLEFEIASLIARLDSVNRARIGILSGIPALSATAGSDARSAIQRAIENQYSVSWLSDDMFSLPPELDTIIIAQPRALTEFSLYLLDQYLTSGGRVIVFADPEPVMHQQRSRPDTLTGWWSRWGLSLGSDIVTDESLGLPVSVQTSSGMSTVSQPLFPAPGPAQFNSDDFLTENLQQRINFGAPGYPAITPVEGLQVNELISTSAAPGLISAEAREGQMLGPSVVRQVMMPHDGALPLAVRISGPFPAHFDERPQPALPDDPVLARLAAAEAEGSANQILAIAPAEILFIPDTDILFDAFYINPQDGTTIGDNRAFIMTAIDQFAGNQDLARLRARPPAIRPMTRVTDLRSEAEALYLARQTEIEDELISLERSIASADEADALALRAEYLDARQALRDLQRRFRSSIDQLEFWLRLWTIWLPVFLAFLISATIRFWMRRLT